MKIERVVSYIKKDLFAWTMVAVTIGIGGVAVLTARLLNTRDLNPDKSFAVVVTPTPIASTCTIGFNITTPTPTITPTPPITTTITPTPECTTVTPRDPPHGICATSGTTGSAFWEWHPVPYAVEYEVDIYRADGTLFLNNTWRPSSVYNCDNTINKCSYVTTNMPFGSYYSMVRARGGCSESNWHQSITITVSQCPLVTPTPTPKPKR